MPPPVPGRDRQQEPTPPPSPVVFALGRSRLVVFLAVVAVMLVSFSLVLLGTIVAINSVWHAWLAFLQRPLGTTALTVEFLEIVSVMLKAVVFYLIGIGLYSLFIAPLNIAVALGVETLYDLETRVVSVVVVIMAVTFLEHFIRWESAIETLQYGGALALVVAALVLFQMHNHRTKQDEMTVGPDTQGRARRELFRDNFEQVEIPGEDGAVPPGSGAGPS